MNSDPVCFGARGDKYGTFSIKERGFVYTFKLVHKNGSLQCTPWNPPSYWGCTHHGFGDKNLVTVVTYTNRTALLLADYLKFVSQSGGKCRYYSYQLDGVNVNSTELVFNNLPSPLPVSFGQEFQIWYGPDLFDCAEHDNTGQTCANVFAWYL